MNGSLFGREPKIWMYACSKHSKANKKKIEINITIALNKVMESLGNRLLIKQQFNKKDGKSTNNLLMKCKFIRNYSVIMGFKLCLQPFITISFFSLPCHSGFVRLHFSNLDFSSFFCSWNALHFIKSGITVAWADVINLFAIFFLPSTHIPVASLFISD